MYTNAAMKILQHIHIHKKIPQISHYNTLFTVQDMRTDKRNVCSKT